MPDEEFERQRLEWEEFETACLVKGECPYGGSGQMQTVMDVWQRRVLMCAVCDCFGYPLVMSDSGDTYGVLDPEIERQQNELADADPPW